MDRPGFGGRKGRGARLNLKRLRYKAMLSIQPKKRGSVLKGDTEEAEAKKALANLRRAQDEEQRLEGASGPCNNYRLDTTAATFGHRAHFGTATSDAL